jgi:lipopolysaccharide export system permease protein
MPLLDRLLLREIAIPLGVGLLAILQLLVILQLLQLNEVVFTSAVTVSDLMRVTAALAPHFLVSAVPLAFMLGVQLGLGRLAADQEVLALSAAGTHPLRLYRVPLAIGLVLAVCVAALTRWAEPWGLQQLNRVLNDVIKRNLQSGLEPGIFNDALPRFTIYVASEDPAENSAYATWHGVLIEDDVGDGAPLLALAELGRIEDAEGPALALRLFQGELHRMEAKGETVARFQEGRFLIGVQDSVAHKNKFARNEAALTSGMMRDRLSELQRRGDVRESARLRVEMVRRWAVPLVCLAFAFFGVPLAVATRGGRASAYIVTLGVFVAFYALSRFGVALAENGLNAWVAGFLPDAVVLALGGAYTHQLVRSGIGKPR